MWKSRALVFAYACVCIGLNVFEVSRREVSSDCVRPREISGFRHNGDRCISVSAAFAYLFRFRETFSPPPYGVVNSLVYFYNSTDARGNEIMIRRIHFICFRRCRKFRHSYCANCRFDEKIRISLNSNS